MGIYAGWGGFPQGVEAASLCSHCRRLERATDLGGRDQRRIVCPEDPPALHARRVGGPLRARHQGTQGPPAIERFVREGGYIGICAGSYYAARQISWSGKTWSYDIDLFPGVPSGPIRKIAPWPYYVTTGVKLDTGHPITAGGPARRVTLYYGGPVLEPREGSGVKVLGTFEKTGQPAIVAFEKGKGKVFLSAVHLEFDLTSEVDNTPWPENEKGIEDDQSDWEMLQRAARWILGELPDR
ncbi:MAG: BPL-N domain-containing protein [Acidobacteriota bacterium]|nr:BPL-N domain-containing protein [Acidobacteriota bacterium]